MKPINFLPFAILLISVSSILQWCSLPIGNTFLWWLLDALILLSFYLIWPKGYRIPEINIFLICVCCSFVYGAVLQAENYWDWKLLVGNLLIFLLPLASYAFYGPDILGKTLRFWYRYAWIILLLLMPFLASDAYGRFLVPYTFLALCMSIIDKKNLIIVIIAYLITITLGGESRSDIVKFTVCIVLGLCLSITFVRNLIIKHRRLIIYSLWTLPVIFFLLALSGTFNVFKIEEEFGLEGKYTMKSETSDSDISALADTRTFLYVEEISSALKHNYVIQGRSMARGYDSIYFGDAIDQDLGVKRGERGSCETSILNIFNYFGLIGVVIYFSIFVGASYKAVTQSNNIYVQIIGIYVAFRWVFGWVEDFSKFDLNYLFLWIMIGICFSPQYRSMSNTDFKNWLTQYLRG